MRRRESAHFLMKMRRFQWRRALPVAIAAAGAFLVFLVSNHSDIVQRRESSLTPKVRLRPSISSIFRRRPDRRQLETTPAMGHDSTGSHGDGTERRTKIYSAESRYGNSNHIDNLRTSYGSVQNPEPMPIFTQQGIIEKKQRYRRRRNGKGKEEDKRKRHKKGKKSKNIGSDDQKENDMGTDDGLHTAAWATKLSKGGVPGNDSASAAMPDSTRSPQTVVSATCQTYSKWDESASSVLESSECSPTVWDAIQSQPNLTTLVYVLRRAGLTDILTCGGGGAFTLLAPTNKAWNEKARDSPSVLTNILRHGNEDLLQALILNHVVPGQIDSTTIHKKRTIWPSFGGRLIRVRTDRVTRTVKFNGKAGTLLDKGGCNGVIYLLDSVLPDINDVTSVQSPAVTPNDETTFSPTLRIVAAPSTTPDSDVSMVTAASDYPSLSPNSASTTTPAVEATEVRVENYYIAYRAPAATVAPTQIEFEEMRKRTESYYTSLLADKLANGTKFHFVGMKSILNKTAFGTDANLPSENFNIYMQYQYTEFTFNGSPPHANATFKLLKSGITVDYIVQSVRTMTGTPFESTIEVFLSKSPKPSAGSNQTIRPSNSSYLSLVNMIKADPKPLPSSASSDPTSKIRISSYYISYRAPEAIVSPSKQEFEEMRIHTEKYYSSLFANHWANETLFKFIELKSELNHTAFGDEANVPSHKFNIYMKYQFSVVKFAEGSLLPESNDIFDLLKSGITVDYIMQIVRAMTGTPFASTVEVFMSKVDES